MQIHDIITIERDCEGLLIPTAMPITIPQGTQVQITQMLGGSYTVLVNGNLVRIEPKNADALGEQTTTITQSIPKTGPFAAIEESEVWNVLKTCYDPEIPVNIVELGLIYECNLQYLGPEQGNVITIKMTLTAPGCGMGPVLADEIKNKLEMLPDVVSTTVEIVFDPPWSREMMSEVAKLELGMI